jgi:hypothetical protein
MNVEFGSVATAMEFVDVKPVSTVPAQQDISSDGMLQIAAEIPLRQQECL